MSSAPGLRVAQGGQVPFVGRAREVAWLRQIRELVRTGEPRVVLVEGDSGLGKSRLVRESIAEADAAAWQTLWIRIVPGAAPPQEFLASSLGEQALRAGILDVPALDRLARAAEPLSATAASFVALAAGLGGRRSLILGIDDLQAAEAGAMNLFQEFVAGLADTARTSRARVMVVVTHQPPPPGSPLAQGLARLVREPICLSLKLDGLDPSEIAELLKHSLGQPCAPRLVEAVQRASGGNPFFVIELAGHLDRQGALLSRDSELEMRLPGGELHLPASATASVLARLQELDPATTGMLRTAALLGGPFTISDLAHGLGGELPPGALDRAAALGLLHEAPGGLLFSHEILQRAIADSLGPAQRRDIHIQIARGLRDPSPGDSRGLVSLALHLLAAEGAGMDPVELGSLCDRAGDAANSSFTWESALRLFEAALAIVPYFASLDPTARGWLQCRTARVNGITGSRPRARELYAAAIENLRGSSDFHAWGLAVLGWARTFTSAGEPIPDDALEREFSEAAGNDALDLRVRLLTQRADALQLARDPRDEEAARAAVALSTRSTDREARAGAVATLGLVQMRHLDPAAALASFEAAERETLTLDSPIGRGWGPARKAWPMIVLGDLRGAARAARQAGDTARTAHDWVHGALSAAFLHSIEVLNGDAEAANLAGREAVRLIDRSTYLQASFILDAAVAWDRLLRAEFEEAIDAAAQWSQRAGAVASAPLRLLIAARTRGADAVAEELLRQPWRFPVRDEPDFVSLGPLCVSAELAAELQSEEIAGQVLSALTPVAGRGLVFSLAPPILIPRALGIAATVAGRYVEADHHLRAAADLAGSAGARSEIALTALARARLLHRAGNAPAEDIRPLLQVAGELARDCGLLWLTTAVREAAAGFGLPTAPGVPGAVFADELSTAEREVLIEFASARSVAQIAATLLLHERTVEAHLDRLARRLAIVTPELAAAYLGLAPRQQSPSAQRKGRLAELTRRELEVLQLLARGLTNQQIADELVISLHTAIRHVANILEKTGSANRTEAASLAAAANR